LSKILIDEDWKELEKELDEFLKNPHEEILEFLTENFSKIFLKNKSGLSLSYFYSFGTYYLSIGKIQYSQNLLDVYFQNLYEQKRIPSFKKSFHEIKSLGLVSKKIIAMEKSIDHVLGNKTAHAEALKYNSILENYHEKYWGNEKKWLEEKILVSKLSTTSELEKVLYYLKKYGSNEQIIEKIKNVFPLEFKSKNTSESKSKNNEFSYKLNYDEIALEFLKNPEGSKLEETKIINYLKVNFDEELELDEKIVAFKFLGMNRVVSYISGELVKRSTGEKEKINLEILRIEAELELGNFHHARDYAQDVLSSTALLKSEEILVWYCLGESYHGIKDFKNAKKYFDKVNLASPGYRLVKTRLEEIEKNK